MLQSRSMTIRRYLRENPSCTANQVAEALGCSVHLVYAAARRGGLTVLSPRAQGKTAQELYAEAELLESKANTLRQQAKHLEKCK